MRLTELNAGSSLPLINPIPLLNYRPIVLLCRLPDAVRVDAGVCDTPTLILASSCFKMTCGYATALIYSDPQSELVSTFYHWQR